MRTFRRAATPICAAAICAAGSAAHAAPDSGAPPVYPAPVPPVTCAAAALRGTYTFVPGSNATGHVEYILTLTNRSATLACAFPTPLRLTLLGRGGRPLPTTQIAAPGPAQEVTLAPGQWAQAISQLSPDLAGPGEPTRGSCEPTARALRVGVGAATIRAAMDPTPVCQHGTIDFGQVKTVALTPGCTTGSLSAAVRRLVPPFDGFAQYALTLRNRSPKDCHADSIVGLRLLSAAGHALSTTVRAGISAPFVIRSHVTDTASVRVATRGGHCDAAAPRLRVVAIHGTALSTTIQPPVTACRAGLIELSSLFRNG